MSHDKRKPYRSLDLRPLDILVDGVYESWVKVKSRPHILDWPSIETINNKSIVWLTDDEYDSRLMVETDPKEFLLGDLVYIWTLEWQGTGILEYINTYHIVILTEMNMRKQFSKDNAILLSRLPSCDI